MDPAINECSIPEECRGKITSVNFIYSDLIVLFFEPVVDKNEKPYLAIIARYECCDKTYFAYDQRFGDIRSALIGKRLKKVVEGKKLKNTNLENEVRTIISQQNLDSVDFSEVLVFPIFLVVTDGETDETIDFYRVDISNGYYSGALELRTVNFSYPRKLPSSTANIREALLFVPSLRHFTFGEYTSGLKNESDLVTWVFLKKGNDVNKFLWLVKITTCDENYFAKIEVFCNSEVSYDNNFYGKIGYRFVINIDELEKEIQRIWTLVQEK